MSHLSKSRRYEILARDRFTCRYCGKAGGQLEVDHVIPLSRGGEDTDQNLVASCFDCNRGKSNKIAPIGVVGQSGRVCRSQEWLAIGFSHDLCWQCGVVVQDVGNLFRLERFGGLEIRWGRYKLTGRIVDVCKHKQVLGDGQQPPACRLYSTIKPFVEDVCRLLGNEVLIPEWYGPQLEWEHGVSLDDARAREEAEVLAWLKAGAEWPIQEVSNDSYVDGMRKHVDQIQKRIVK